MNGVAAARIRLLSDNIRHYFQLQRIFTVFAILTVHGLWNLRHGFLHHLHDIRQRLRFWQFNISNGIANHLAYIGDRWRFWCIWNGHLRHGILHHLANIRQLWCRRHINLFKYRFDDGPFIDRISPAFPQFSSSSAILFD